MSAIDPSDAATLAAGSPRERFGEHRGEPKLLASTWASAHPSLPIRFEPTSTKGTA